MPIRPGTDGLLALALVHVLLRDGTIDYEFLARYTNAPWLVVDATRTSRAWPVRARRAMARPLVFDACARQRDRRTIAHRDASRRCSRRVHARRRPRTWPTVLTHARRALRSATTTRRTAVAERCGIAADTHRAPRARDGARRVRGGDRAADRMDRRLGPPARQGRRAAGRVARDARHLARTRTASRRAARCICCRCCSARSTARATFARGAVSEADPAARSCRRPTLRSRTSRSTRAPLGFPMSPDDLAIDERRHAAAHRQGVLVGVAASPRTG